MFNLGDVVIMNSHDEGGAFDYDNREVPLGTTGTVVSLLEDDEEESGEFIAINWEDSCPVGYNREFFNPDADCYDLYNKVWIVSINALKNITDTTNTVDYKTKRIISKINAINKKVQDKTLKLRKITPIPFPKIA